MEEACAGQHHVVGVVGDGRGGVGVNELVVDLLEMQMKMHRVLNETSSSLTLYSFLAMAVSRYPLTGSSPSTLVKPSVLMSSATLPTPHATSRMRADGGSDRERKTSDSVVRIFKIGKGPKRQNNKRKVWRAQRRKHGKGISEVKVNRCTVLSFYFYGIITNRSANYITEYAAVNAVRSSVQEIV